MRSNINKMVLDAIVCNKALKSKSVFSMREKRGVDLFLSSLTKVINKYTKEIISSIEVVNSVNDINVLDSFDKNIHIHLRIFQDNIVIVLPSEFVFALCRSSTKESDQAILNEISIKEATMLSYLLVTMFAKDELFRSQRIYLAGVTLSDNRKIKDELVENINLENSEILDFDVNLQNESFKVVAIVSSKVFQRIKSYLRLAINKEFLIQKINLHFNLEFSLNALSVGSLFTFKKGNQIDLQRMDASWSLRLLNKDENISNSKIALKCVSIRGKKGLQFKLC